MLVDGNKELKNRLIYLFTGELFSVVVFTFLYFYYFSSNTHYSLAFTLIILNFILLQGSFYWFIKLQRLKSKKIVFPTFYKSLKIFKKLNLVLICIVPLLFITDIVTHKQISVPLFFALFVYAFTIIEYVNYYY